MNNETRSTADMRSESEAKIAREEYDVFISYNHKDREHVKRIVELLLDNGIAPWLDEWGLRPGFSWKSELERQIVKSKSAAIFIGNAGIGPWQQEEVEALMDEYVSRKCPVIPILLPDAPESIVLRPFLRLKKWVDFRKTDPDPVEHLLWGIIDQRPKIRRRTVLIASLGESPVVVSAMYDQLTQRKKLTIDELMVICPKRDTKRDEKEDEVALAYKQLQETLGGKCTLKRKQLPFEDANSWQMACIFLQELYNLLDLYKQTGMEVHLSLAGGRKSMAALTAWVAPLFPCVKGLYHIVEDDEERSRFVDVYRIEKSSLTQRKQYLHPDLEHFDLVTIPLTKGQRIDQKLHEELLSATNKQLDALQYTAIWKAENIALLQAIAAHGGKILGIWVTEPVAQQFITLSQQQPEQAHALHTTLIQLSNTTELQHLETQALPYKPSKKKLHSFDRPTNPIKLVFRTEPEAIDKISDENSGRLIVCALDIEKDGEHKTPEAMIKASDFSLEPVYQIDKLPPIPSPQKSILIVPLGKYPMVATQLYTLLTRLEKRIISEVVLVYPQGAVDIDNGARIIQRVLQEREHVECTLATIKGLDDIRDSDACSRYQQKLEDEIERVTGTEQYRDHTIDLALSGGRKGMTAMTIFAAQKKHIPFVYHTLITDKQLNNDDYIEKHMSVTALNKLNDEAVYNRLFLCEYKVEKPHPYAKFTLFRVPVFSTMN